MSRYRKLGVAIIGAVLIAGKEFFDIELGVTADQLWDGGISALTAFGVWAAPNAR